MKAYDVLIECIKNYNCKLFQDEGYWKIVNDQEPDSYRVIYNWSDLSVKSARAQNNRIVDINHLKPYGTDWPLSKIAPVKRLRITFRNKNLGDNEILNGDFSSGNPPDNWTNYGWDSFTNPGGYAKTTETSTNYDTKYIESDPFTLSGVSDEDQLEISFDAKLKSITFSTGNWYPNVYAALVDPDGGVSYGRQYVISIEDGKYETLQHNFPLNGLNGDYRLRLYVEPHPASPTSELTYYWDNAKGVHRNTANTTTDSVYIFDNNGEGYREEEIEVLFGDSLQNSDVGALKDGSNLTASWCRYNKSESETIIHLLGQQIINYNQSFKNSFSVEIIDLENIIKFGSVLLFKSKYYIFSNFKEDASENNKTGDLIQINNSEASVTESIQGLTSVDGESEGTGSGQIVQGSYWLPTAEGIYTNRNVAVGMAPTGTYDLEIAGDVDIGGTLSVAIDVTVGGTSVSLQGHTHVAADVTDLATWIENNIGLGELHNVALGSEALGMPLTYGGSSWAPARLQFEWIDPMYSASPSTNDVVKWSGSAWVVGSVPAYSHGFVGGHTDTPGTYSGSAGYLVMVNSTPDAVIFQPTTVLYSLSHDSFAGFVANEHINHTSVSIIAGTGLTGGGTIAASRTLNWAADLADLGDVTGTSTQWYFLGYNGAGAYTFYPARLDKLGDVTYSTPSQDYVVKYDSGSGWIIGSVPVGSHALTDHSDITISGAAEGDYLRKSAGDWQNYPLASVKGEINYWTLTGSDVYYSNKVGIGTTPHTTAFLHIQDVGFTLPSISSATKLIIEDSDYAYVSIMAPTAGALRFGDAASEQAGQIYYTHSNDEMKFKAGGSDMVYITTVGLGINGSPSYALDISAGYVQVDSGYGIGNWSDGANKSAIEFGDGTYGTNS
ncbi:MAG: hypothetical protein JXL67_06215, partial [Calditrichaeota bacterium]|nr:hypothetical protein [Calditrichota bacterium]